jgi:hypothetical protein
MTKLGMPVERARSVAQFLRDQSTVMNPSEPTSRPQGASEGEVDALVNGGDRHLLDVADKVAVTILVPRGFWEELRSALRSPQRNVSRGVAGSSGAHQ